MADPARHLVLVGMMGAGKTTVGRACAQSLERPFVDTDDLVSANAGGVSVAELFELEGEAGFRAREKEAVADACASPVPVVIACGGGAIVDADNRRRLRTSGFVVWLQAPTDELHRRVGPDSGRPLLAAGGRGSLERIAALRADAYAASADATVDTSGRTIPDVVTDVLQRLPSSIGAPG
ncbi:MAG: shikimate kinase [Actinomycetia bacterium]|nr:shikimate kinase [Actinomycetes bacterium]